MPVEANLQKILIRHINFDTQNKSATSSFPCCVSIVVGARIMHLTPALVSWW